MVSFPTVFEEDLMICTDICKRKEKLRGENRYRRNLSIIGASMVREEEVIRMRIKGAWIVGLGPKVWV